MARRLLYQQIESHRPTRFYRLDEATGATTATDFGSDKADLTHNNSPTVGAAGPKAGMKSVLYASASSQFSTGTNYTISDEQTVVILCRSTTTSNPGVAEYFFCSGTDLNNRTTMQFISTGALRITHEFGGDDRSWDTSGDVYDATWHLFGFSVNHTATTILGYVDGSEDGAAGTVARATNSGECNIGAQNSSGDLPFDGSVAMAAVIPAYLTANQHKSLYDAYARPDPMRNRIARGVRRPRLI